MKRVLSRQGYQTQLAENGRIALEILENWNADIVLLDLMMPEMDGFDFVSNVRRNNKWTDVPIVVITAKSLTKEDRSRLHGGIDSILDKKEADIEVLLADLSLQLKKGLNPAQ